jgi:hypothetical protein
VLQLLCIRGLRARWRRIGAHDCDLLPIGRDDLIRADYPPELIEDEAIDHEDGRARVVPEFQEIGRALARSVKPEHFAGFFGLPQR